MIHLDVAAALIVNDQGQVLCVKRGASKFASTAFRWEFPGGKIDPGETPAQAAVREVQEELNLPIRALSDGPVVHHTYPEFSITLHAILCVCTEHHTPHLNEHIDASWRSADDLWELDFAAADQPLLLWLRERTFGTHLRTQTFGRCVTFLESCTSTNDILLAQAEKGAPEGTLVVSERQHAGRGRMGRSWISEPGQALLFSFLVRPPLPREDIATVTLVAGLAVTLALREWDIPVGLKWPNDVLLEEKKLCGILCEAQSSMHGIEGIVIGIGVNTGVVPEAVAYRATAPKQRLNRLALLAQILRVFEALYQRWLQGGLKALRAELDACDAKRGKSIVVKLSETPTTGTAMGIGDDGALQLRLPNGEMTALHCGEILQWG
jgi:BirA family biotin operon repressor/biotin-[acetyl-CoA-carboxylase] ligase